MAFVKAASKTSPPDAVGKAEPESSSFLALAGWFDPRSRLRGMFFILFAAGIFAYLGYQVEGDSFWAIFPGLHPAVWIAGLAVISVLPAVAALRWRIMLDGMAVQLSWRRCLVILLGIYPINLISPSRLGDLLRAYALRNEVRPAKVFASVIADRFFDLLALSLLCMAGGVVLGKVHSVLVAIGVISAIACIVTLAVWADHLPLGQKFRDRLCTFGEALRTLLRSPALLVKVFLLALLHWIVTAVLFALLFYGVGASIPFGEVLALAPIAIFIGLVPITFGGMGTRDAALVYLFAASVSTAQALAVGVLYTIFTYGVLALVGLPFTRRSLKL